MPHIYRVETTEGLGPYKAGAINNYNGFNIDRHNCDVTHPGYSQDEVLHNTIDRIRDYNFGFSTKQQLRKWFNKKERKLLAKKNFYVTKYKVPAKYVVKSNCQAVFIRKHAIKLVKYDLLEF